MWWGFCWRYIITEGSNLAFGFCEEGPKENKWGWGRVFWAKSLWGNDGNGIRIVNSVFRKERRGTVECGQSGEANKVRESHMRRSCSGT